MAEYVVLVTGADGTQSIVGTKTGHPFSSKANAERVAGQYADDSVAASAMLIERQD